MNDLYFDLVNKYKREIDQVINTSYENIIEKESLVKWERHLDKILYIFEKVVMNDVEICQCFELSSLINSI